MARTREGEGDGAARIGAHVRRGLAFQLRGGALSVAGLAANAQTERCSRNALLCEPNGECVEARLVHPVVEFEEARLSLGGLELRPTRALETDMQHSEARAPCVDRQLVLLLRGRRREPALDAGAAYHYRVGVAHLILLDDHREWAALNVLSATQYTHLRSASKFYLLEMKDLQVNIKQKIMELMGLPDSRRPLAD